VFAKYLMNAVGLVVDQFRFAREKSKRVRRDDGAYCLVIVHIGQLHLKVPALRGRSGPLHNGNAQNMSSS
jgi:hypothetical protein